MRDAYLAIGAVMLATIGIRVVLGRVIERLDDPLATLQVIVVRACTGLAFALVAVETVTAGGLWLLLLPVSIVLALFSFALAGGVIWLWVRDGLGEDAEVSG
ncbi:MAG TPA: hypothetical protein VFV91_03460 [Gaiellaceae bacterium]|nr:hypothetical protein [Gaiellaceae bacterium]